MDYHADKMGQEQADHFDDQEQRPEDKGAWFKEGYAKGYADGRKTAFNDINQAIREIE